MADKIVLFGVITLYPYTILMVLGVTVCFLLFMLLTFKRHKQAADENLFVLSMFVVSLGLSFPASVLTDSLFKLIKTGEFVFGSSTFYGGMLCVLAVFPLLLLIKKKHKVSVYERLCDLAPCAPAGHFLGRIGCFLGGCCFGSPTDSCLGVVFPENSPPYNYYGGFVAVHPTQLYEAAYLLGLFLFLFLFVKRDALPLYLILYGAGRIFVEFFRNDDRGGVGLPLSPAQFLSILLIILGAGIFAVRYYRKAPSE